MDVLINKNNNDLVDICTASTTSSDIIGNLTSFMSHYFIKKFPNDFFRKIYISDSISNKNLYRDLFPIQYKPYIYIQPQIELSNFFLGELPNWSTISFLVFKDKSRSYKKIFQDSEEGINIYYIPSRIKVNFTVGIKLQTQMQAWDILSYMNQRFENNGHHYINQVNLQGEIPKSYMINICNIKGWNYSDKGDRIKLREYINQHSFGGIEEIINLSTGNPSFMYNFSPNILVTYPDLPSHDKEMRNLVTKHTQINYAFGAELWYPASYILEIKDYNKVKNINNDYNEDIKDLSKYKYNLVVDHDYVKSNYEEKELLIKKKFITDVNVNVDKLDLSYILDDRMIEIIKLLLENNLNPNKIFKIDLYTDGIKITEDNYKVEYDTLLLKTFKPISNQTYNLFVYVNLELLNKINKLINDNRKDDIKKIHF